MNELILHLGAHKTATTFLQKQLEMNSRNFPEDIHYLPLKETREYLTIPIRRNENISEIRTNLYKIIGKDKLSTLIVSDENLLGSAWKLKKGNLFQEIEEILLRVTEIFDTEIKIVFSIRNYSDFITSLYCEYLRHNTICPIDVFLKKFDIEKSNWVNLYKQIISVFGDKNIFLYDFDSFNDEEFLQLVCPDRFNPQLFQLSGKNYISRPTLSQSFIRLLDQMQQIYNKNLSYRVFKFLEDSPFQEELNRGKRFTLNANLKENLNKIYRKHYLKLYQTGRLINGEYRTALLSVIVPVYNVAPYLQECLDSLLSQKFVTMEVLLINDGSTDGSDQICEKYSRNDPRIRYYSQKNKGLSATRNLGLDQAKGEYIFFLDSDDWLDREDALSLLLEKAEDSKAHMVYCGSNIVSEKGIKYENWSNAYLEEKDYYSIAHKVKLLYPCMCWIKLYRKDFIDSHGIRFLENVLYEDNPWNMETLFYSRKISVTKENLINYRKRHDSITKQDKHTFTIQKHYNLITAYEMDFFDKHLNSKWLPVVQLYWIHQSLIHYFMIDPIERHLYFAQMKKNIRRIRLQAAVDLKTRTKFIMIKILPHFLFKLLVKSSYIMDIE